jgi:hypothetical protein
MKQLKVLSILLVLAGALSSCLKTEDPVPTGLVAGEWLVENVIADGEVGNYFSANSKLHLDLNGTFLFVNVDSRASSGTWTATASTLTLTESDDYIQEFNIVYADNDKLHIYRNLSIITGQTVELRYLFRRN